MIYVAENSNKLQKTKFWKEKSVEDVETLCANGTCHTSPDDIVNRLQPINN